MEVNSSIVLDVLLIQEYNYKFIYSIIEKCKDDNLGGRYGHSLIHFNMIDFFKLSPF